MSAQIRENHATDGQPDDDGPAHLGVGLQPRSMAGRHRLRPQLAALPARTVALDQFAISGWLLWAEPQLIPVADLRSEVYSSEYLTAYRNNESVGPGWQSFITRTGATTALLSEDSALADALQQQLHWRVTGRDGGYVLPESI